MVYWDVGLLTDEDAKTLFNGLTPKELGLREVKVSTERDLEPKKMWAIGLKGMPDAVNLSIRKLRTFYKATVYWDTQWLSRDEQLSKEQAAATWQWQHGKEKESQAVKSRRGLVDFEECLQLTEKDEHEREQVSELPNASRLS